MQAGRAPLCIAMMILPIFYNVAQLVSCTTHTQTLKYPTRYTTRATVNTPMKLAIMMASVLE